MRKILSAGLALATLASATACGGMQAPETADSTTPEVTTEARPSYDFGGRDFTILCRTDRSYEFDGEATGDIVDDAVHARNIAVSEEYNVNLVPFKVDGDWNSRETFIQAIDQSVLAGDDSYQLVAGYNAYITTLITRDLLLDMYKLNVDYSKPWWYSGFNDNVALGGKLYFALGDASLTMWENLNVVYFNTKLLADFKLDSPYKLVEDGKWDFEHLNEYSTAVSADLNGDDIRDENDRYGTIFYNVRDIPVCFGSRYCTLDKDGYPEITLYSERFIDIYDKAAVFLGSSNNARQFAPDVDQKIFSEDRALFFQGPLRYAELFRENKSDFGIVPFPKYDSTQDRYYTTVIDDLSVFSVPATAKDYEFIGVVLDALCEKSSELVVPSYYESALKVKYSRDDESVRMLDLVRESVWFDTGFVYSQALGSIGNFMDPIKDGHTDHASTWAEREPGYKSALEKLITYIKENK